MRTAVLPRPLETEGTGDRRPNLAGFQRALRLALIYLVGLALIFGLFAGFTEAAPTSKGSGATTDLLFFGVAALAFAVVGTLVALHAAPRAIIVKESSIVVIGRWGRRTAWAPRSELRLRVVRRHPAGFLSSEPVESIELAVPGRPAQVYLVTQGLFPGAPTSS